MNGASTSIRGLSDYLAASAVAVLAAALFSLFGTHRQLPVLGTEPLLPVTLLAAAFGLGASLVVTRRGICPAFKGFSWDGSLWLFILGSWLALPPIAIDFYLRFPRDINLPLPDALFFYPAIALVAEVLFHLIPLAALVILLPRKTPTAWLFFPVILVEPLFQAVFTTEAPLQSALVLGNVTLISAAQLWLFRRYGFAAMIGLRLAFYLIWHILWGTVRLDLLF